VIGRADRAGDSRQNDQSQRLVDDEPKNHARLGRLRSMKSLQHPRVVPTLVAVRAAPPNGYVRNEDAADTLFACVQAVHDDAGGANGLYRC
jgi:hypothetical protein